MNFVARHREILAAANFVVLGLIAFAGMLNEPSWTGVSVVHHLAWRMAAQGTSSALAFLAAAWVVWGSGRLTTRAALSSLTVVVLALLWLFISSRGWRWLGPRAEYQLLTLGTWLGGLVLCAAAWKFGIRIVDRSGRSLAGDPRSRQMSLLGLLALMSGAAVTLAVLRRLIPSGGLNWHPTGDDLFRLVAQMIASLLVASTLITCFHVPRPLWLNLLLVCAFVPAIAALHLVAYGQTYGMSLFPPDLRIQLRIFHYLALTGWLLAALGLLSGCGLRLRRMETAAPRLRSSEALQSI